MLIFTYYTSQSTHFTLFSLNIYIEYVGRIRSYFIPVIMYGTVTRINSTPIISCVRNVVIRYYF